MPPKKSPPKGRHTTLRVKHAKRVEWDQKTWEKLASKYAEIEIRCGQAGGKVPGFKPIMDEAQAALLPADQQRHHLNHLKGCPNYFASMIKAEKDKILKAARTAHAPQPQPAQALPDVAKESPPPSEMEGIAELLQRTAENQERLEAKMENSHRFQENLFVVLEAILTAPDGTKQEELMKQPEVKVAMRAMEKPEVILAGIPPKYEERIVRQYGGRIKLRVFPVGGTRKLQEVNNLQKVEHIVCASELHGAGLERIMREKGYKKRLIHAGGMTDVRKTLDTILGDPESLYRQAQA